MDDLRRTPLALWLAVALMCLGFGLVGGAVVALSMSTSTAIVLFVTGGIVGLSGLALAARRHIMRNVD
jgi:hypothetical protein